MTPDLQGCEERAGLDPLCWIGEHLPFILNLPLWVSPVQTGLVKYP